MGIRVAHIFAYPNVIDYIDIAPGFGIVDAPPAAASPSARPSPELDLGRRQLSPVALRRGDRVTVNPAASETIEPRATC